MAVVAVFGGGLFEEDSLEYNAAVSIGRELAKKQFDIATGGYGGIMEAALRGASESNVRRIGITTDFYKERKPNAFVSEEIRVEDYIGRLRKLVEVADAYIVLPGETGTLLELAAIWTLKEKDIINKKPLICLGDQWNEVIQTMAFYSEKLLDHSESIAYAETPDDVVSFIINSFDQ